MLKIYYSRLQLDFFEGTTCVLYVSWLPFPLIRYEAVVDRSASQKKFLATNKGLFWEDLLDE